MTTLLRELIDELPELFGPSDRSKEIGIAAIFLYYHSIVALAERNSKFATLPPVLISTLSVLAGLGLLHGALGAEATADIVSYFDPSVQFLGNYMSLWLVPPLVLLPKAVRKIPDAGSIVWIKLVFVHFRYAILIGTKFYHFKYSLSFSSQSMGPFRLWGHLAR